MWLWWWGGRPELECYLHSFNDFGMTQWQHKLSKLTGAFVRMCVGGAASGKCGGENGLFAHAKFGCQLRYHKCLACFTEIQATEWQHKLLKNRVAAQATQTAQVQGMEGRGGA